METLASICLEAENPRVTMRTAVRAIFYRYVPFRTSRNIYLLWFSIVLLYVLSLWLVGLCVQRSDPSLLDANNNSSTAAKSPFVVVIKNAGIKVLDHIINAVVLTSAFSSGNEFMYASSRALFQLAQQGQAPRIFTKVNKLGVPVFAVFVSFLFSFLSFLTVDSGAEKAFTWLGNITALGSMITWTGIAITFLRFYYGMKKQGISRDVLPFHTAFQPYFAWSVLIGFLIIIFFNGWTNFHDGFDVEGFFSSYINIFFGTFYVAVGSS
jgi:amino acid transporter